jgi:hypothetical protein
MLSNELLFRSSIVNFINTSLMYLITNQNITDIKFFIFFIEYLMSIFLTYFLDIMFVQSHFSLNGELIKLSYKAFEDRFFQMFKTQKFFKFIVLFGINIIMNKSIIQYITNILNKNNILNDPKSIKYRDLAISIFINIFTGLLYIDVLKFNWAYIDTNNNMILNIIIFMWFTLSILITVSTK